MTPERWQRIDEILQAALDCAPQRRKTLLDEACAGDEALRKEVEALLASDGEAGSFIERPASEVAAELLADDQVNSAIGQHIDHYKIVEHLGSGGMGEVYSAYDTRTGRKVALKLLPRFFTENQQRVRRFQQEARAILALNHPSIVTIYEIGQEGGTHFIATELIEGETLRERLRRAPMRIHEVLDVCIQVASALTAAHQAGIVHRDIKPENIMMRPDGYVKVLDFGIAKLTERSQSASSTQVPTRVKVDTEPGMVMGTAHYMSPEQARASKVDERTDIFSLGVVTYEMVAGRAPFEGASAGDVIAAILEHEAPPLARFARAVPTELERIVSKALRKDREERYQVIKDMALDLKSLKQELEFEAKLERSVEPDSRSAARLATSNEQAEAETDSKSASGTVAAGAGRQTSSAEYLAGEIKQHKRAVILTLAALLLVIAGVVWGLKYTGRNQLPNKSPEPFSKIKLTRLTTNGKARLAVISPDGKYIAHAMGDTGQVSIWLRHIATGSDKEIVPSTDGPYCCPLFSRDGSYIYYARVTTDTPSVLYQVPVLGGAPRAIVEDVDSVPALSPDGKRLAFIRGFPPQGIVALMVANVDGTGEQKLATYDITNFFPRNNGMTPAWSPDGEIIVIRAPTSDAQGSYWQMLAVRVKDGAATRIGSQRWTSLGQFGWLADGSGLIFTASDQAPGSPLQLWYIAYPNGEARKVTNDLNDYRGVSLTADSTALVTVPFEFHSNIWIAPGGEAGRAAQITSNKYDGSDGIAFAPDGRVVYTSRAGGNPNLWITNADGTGQKQLTADTHLNVTPVVSPDGRYVVFGSDRAGSQNIWRMNIDGANPKQLTSGWSDEKPHCSPDSRWVVYTSNDNGRQRVWRVPIDGGNAAPLTDYTSAYPIISPDGKQIACGYFDEQAKPGRWIIILIPFEGGQPTKRFDMPSWPLKMRWSSDGRALTYVLTRAGNSNIWSLPVDGRKPVQLTDFKSDQIYWFDWSRDGKQLALARGPATSDIVLINDLK
ncbi:MAG TPA: protein kinase [Pyrinomonadaceae bacterium]|jgi:serine/threonine protein kinase/Tol biopolymer transport system component